MARRRAMPSSPRKNGATRGRLFDDLLVPSLHAAFAFAEDDCAALPIAEPLHLDVLGRRAGSARDRRARRRRPHARDRRKSSCERSSLSAVSTICMPIPPPPADRFDDDRIADARGMSAGQSSAPASSAGNGSSRPGTGVDARRAGDDAALSSCRQRVEDLGRRPDEHHARVQHRARKRALLAQKAVAGMNRLGARLSCRGDDGIDVAGSCP